MKRFIVPTMVAVAAVTAAPYVIAGNNDALRPTEGYHPMRSLAPLVQAVEPAVVAIEVEGRAQKTSMPMGLEEFFGAPHGGRGIAPPVRGEGSGVIVSADGRVLTNHHVIDGAETIRARFSNGGVVDLELVGSDPTIDIALLQLPEGNWPYVELGTSADVEVGDWVVAAGNPLGLGNTVTAGIISGKGRALGMAAYDDFLQTDAAINAGNSGGPLFDLDGDVIGINTAIIQGANTVGFAVPVDMVREAIPDLEAHGHVTRGFIGVRHRPVTPDIAQAMGLSEASGALVAEVVQGTPAADAGVVPGDIITEVDDTTVADPDALIRAIGSRKPGERVKLSLLRDGRSVDVRVTLAAKPGAAEVATATEDAPHTAALGLQAGSLTAELSHQLGARSGVVVTAVGSGTAAAGHLEAGDVIVAVNRRAVRSPDELEYALSVSGSTVILLVQRGNSQRLEAIRR